MPTALRYSLLAIAGIVLVIGAGLATVAVLLDPNDYKARIEQLVEEKTRLNLTLDGDIGWSFMPLGLELNAVSARLDDAPFMKLERLVARVSLASLLKMQPAVHRFELIGLDLNLAYDEAGRGNWERILPEEAATETKPSEKSDVDATDRDLMFEVDEVTIADTRVHYHDARSGQTLTLDEFSLQSSAVRLGQSFPVALSFHVALAPEAGAEPIDVNSQLSAQLTLGEKLNRLILEALDARLELQGEATGGQRLVTKLRGAVDADLAQKTVTLDDLVANVGALTLHTSTEVSQFDTRPQLKGHLKIAEFSPRQLLPQLGLDAPQTSDPTALKRLSLETELGGEPGQIQLKPLTLRFDDSRLNGEVRYTLDSGALFARLKLDKLNADRYLPPAPPEEEADDKPEADAEPESDLLPLDTLRTLTWDLALNADALIIQQIPLSALTLQSTADKGVIRVNPLAGQLYDGSIRATATIDASANNPQWQVQAAVTDVKTLPLLTQLADMRQFSGKASINATLNSRGNRVSQLRAQAKGQADFAIREGKLTGTSMAAYACKGIALIHKETIDTASWPRETPFTAMKGQLTINGHTLDNTGLTVQMQGMALEGAGQVNADTLNLDYQAGLRILAADPENPIHEDPACRVNEKLTNLVIPVSCKGPLAGEEGLPCGFDSARFRETLADMARAEAKRKASEEIDRGREKLREKAQEKLKKLFQ